ncbi:MAG: neutral/alkaline non-lysosomal ceramidase N-terminal domain-containing protein [Bryobacteraceae bacterium]|nr:neutral/alkaline non-lysosomal ceramidase N-terminal domain-containing protein [Bryobacteraceae bacterium]
MTRRLAGIPALACLAALGAPLSLDAGAVRAGYAKTEITPREPIEMAGYDLRGAPSDGVHPGEKLYVRAVVFSDGVQTVAFVSADVIGIRDTDEFRKRISAATGIPFGNILLGDAHNHASPSPSAKGENEWERRFATGLVATVKTAQAGLQPVRIAAGAGHSRIAMNRRQVKPQDADSFLTFDENARSQSFGKFKTDQPAKVYEFGGVMRIGANPAGPIDDAVQVVRIDAAGGKPLAVMIHYACHGTSLGGRNSKISGEWMGRMQEYLEQQIPGAGAIYLQGAAGDINPRVVGGLDGYQDNINVTRALGEEIGREAVRVYRTLAPEPLEATIQVESEDIRLPRAYRELFDDFKDTAVIAPTSAVRVGDLMWVTFPGEMFHAIGKRVKAACPAPHAHLFGYVNGYIGYFTEREAYAEGGYEPATSHLDPAAEEIYMRQVGEFLKRFH